MSVALFVVAGAVATTMEEAVEALVERMRYRCARRGSWKRDRFN